MKTLMDFLQLFGINVNITESSSPIYLLACCILVLNIVGLFCFINVLIYFTVIYITAHKIFKEQISKYPYLVKIFNFYKQMRLSYLLLDILLFFISIGSVIWLCSRLIWFN